MAGDARLFNAIWIEWTGDNHVHRNIKAAPRPWAPGVLLDGHTVPAVVVSVALLLPAAVGDLGLVSPRKTV